MVLMVHVIGYAKNTNCMLSNSFATIVIYVIRNAHQDAIITNIGTADFPAPRIMAAAAWVNASRQYNKETVRACNTPKAMTSASFTKKEINVGDSV